MRKKSFFIFTLILLLIVAIVAIISWLQFKGSAVEQDSDFFISKRDSYQNLLVKLQPHIAHRAAFRYYAQHINLEKRFKAGRYVLKRGMNVIEVARMIALGLQTPVKVTFNNCKIPPHLAAKLAPQLDADSTELVHALRSQELATQLGMDSVTLFSVCIPNTYELYWTTSAEDFVRRMKREYDRFWSSERDSLRARSGLSRMEVMTLASIVYEETRAVDEMPRIAGVYVNRLKKGIPLQADPTVKFAMQDFALRRILYRHLKYPSPYNTYVNRGLPPSPICLPSVAAIEAVLHFERHDYIFFCARPSFDGHHNFARTLREHNANARAYAKELNRRKIR